MIFPLKIVSSLGSVTCFRLIAAWRQGKAIIVPLRESPLRITIFSRDSSVCDFVPMMSASVRCHIDREWCPYDADSSEISSYAATVNGEHPAERRI